MPSYTEKEDLQNAVEPVNLLSATQISPPESMMHSKLPTRKTDFSAWYNALIREADLAENSSTRGSMVIKPHGFALWEHVKNILDRSFKATNHQNVYFPLLIPVSHFTREAKHVEEFAKECAVVTHYRLKASSDGEDVEIDPKATLEEPLVIRPTSETVIWSHFKKWVQSYRDLPVLINQWANVVRWEMRTRPFLRTSEFLWQEGHTAHATATEALVEARQMLEIYVSFIQKEMAIPVIAGEKTAHERFAGAETTYTVEALMQDGKALQMGTSHFLGQHFAKAFDVKFANEKGDLAHVWGTSWGVSTRLLGALIMAHSDDQGLVLPPKIAPIQVVIIPIPQKNTDATRISAQARALYEALDALSIRVKLDDSKNFHPGWKFNEYECKGVPIRIAIGPRDLRNNTAEVTRRDTGEKRTLQMGEIVAAVQALLETMQKALFQKALTFQQVHTVRVDDFEMFKRVMKEKRGFVLAHWDGTTETELAIKAATQATIRCIPTTQEKETGLCVYSGKPSAQRVLFAQAY